MYVKESGQSLIHLSGGLRGRSPGIMLTVADLQPVAVWLDPNHMVATARMIAAGHGLRVLGIVENGTLVGVVRTEALYGQPDSTPVGILSTPPNLILNAETSIREAAALFVAQDVDHAAVVDGARFLGIVTANALLRELGRSWDPLTGLSWSDRLREWGINQLKDGRELTIVFMDLDDFGLYNKRFSHVVGDRVLRDFAQFLQQRIDLETDVLVRYGGDEFVIGTIRGREAAQDLAASLKASMLQRDAESERRVSFCYGVQGGKRTRERENVHFAATLDDLISLASKDCTRQKESSMSRAAAFIAEPESAKPSRKPQKIGVVQVQFDERELEGATQVVLKVDDKIFAGVHNRSGHSAGDSVALATANALESAVGRLEMSVQNTQSMDNSSGQKLVTVSVVRDGERSLPVAGVALVEDDLYRSIAEATIQAFQNGGL